MAAYAPVVDLGRLAELAGVDAGLVEPLNVLYRAPELVGRPVFLVVGDRDHRVGTDTTITLGGRLAEAAEAAGGAKSAGAACAVRARRAHHPTGRRQAVRTLAAPDPRRTRWATSADTLRLSQAPGSDDLIDQLSDAADTDHHPVARS